MFYVSGTKIYLATFDAERKVYPEVKLVRLEQDQLGVVKTGSGVATKPARCRLCSLTEILARFGSTAQPAVLDEDADKGKPAAPETK